MTADDPDRELDPADDLRRAWRPTAPGEHPGDDAWAELAAGAMAPAARAELAAHVVRCRECARTWRAITALGPAPDAPDELARRRGRGRWVTMLAVAATAAAALALVWWRTATPRDELDDGPEVLRGSASGAIEARGPRGPVAADAAFAWQPITSPAIDGYVVHVLTVDGRPVWTSPRVAAPPVALPPAARAPGRYVWYVEAVRGERVVAASRNTDFAIAP